ncbi:hypothetical protein [Candidatus Viadribacter manganicus]|uniref:hypothetical protein n=1 Tax=Candidatus Viadribacter manganicus TaxID=1759059 RepID=UPI0012EA7258|nr:hypothetical protein [Candidatus Viadribacter manganicus]
MQHLPEGDQRITTSSIGEREDGTPYYEGSTYYEAPVAMDPSVLFAPWIESNHLVTDGWRSEAVFGFKRAL